jgi:hypothetical protein
MTLDAIRTPPTSKGYQCLSLNLKVRALKCRLVNEPNTDTIIRDLKYIIVVSVLRVVRATACRLIRLAELLERTTQHLAGNLNAAIRRFLKHNRSGARS